ncbi:hypothetical protein BDA99DRAFT_534089 [Phascolomyces articulosus]|uniref:F-box domain-containing protein n=1 Tax=Phascolomyces articulosus TaxID=60185 RepID=A0AAD5PIK4_9FUNG|nr:hypothetical protein BDA99DRAFT_534089 [Phascolomyces articulosus]
MSFFKQAHDPVLSTVSSKQKEKEASSLSKNPINFLAFTFAGTKNRKAQQQKAAQKMIKKSPTSAKGYFISAQLYQEQDDFNSALNIYLHGLKSVPLDDPYHSSLLKEKQKLLVKIKQRCQGGFYDLLSYDLLYLIFGYLDYKDLLQCARVCRRWNDFMMDWPEFWNKLKLGMPNLHQSTLLSLLHGDTQELRLEGPLDPGLKCDIFWLLSSWEDNHFIQKIHISISDIRLLSNTARCMSATLKQIELIDCSIEHKEDIIHNLLPACSPGLTHVSFLYKSEPRLITYYPAFPTISYQHTITLRRSPVKSQTATLKSVNINYSTLTYLKLDKYLKPLNTYNSNSKDTIIMKLIKRCPNLVHLFLPTCDNANSHISDCIFEAIKSCPRLINLIISVNAQMPQTALSNINENEYDIIKPPPVATFNNISSSSKTIFKKTQKKMLQLPIVGGVNTTTISTCLRRFVFVKYHWDIKPTTFTEVFKACHSSLELLYLSYDGASLGRDPLEQLASLGCPRLREFRLATGDESHIGDNNSNRPMSGIMSRLFSACPALEAIQLDDTYWGDDFLGLDGFVIETIAKKCPRLRHFCFMAGCERKNGARRSHWRSFLHFVNNKNVDKITKKEEREGSDAEREEQQENATSTSQLEYLKVTEMDYETAYILIKNIVSLKYLHIKWIQYFGEKKIDHREKLRLIQEMREILMERGGLLEIQNN